MNTLATSSGTNVAPLIVGALVIGLLFFFMIVRPQKRNVAKHQALVAGLAAGDDIISTAGIYGKIISIDGDTAMVSIAPNTVIQIAVRAIAMKKALLAEPESGEGPSDAATES